MHFNVGLSRDRAACGAKPKESKGAFTKWARSVTCRKCKRTRPYRTAEQKQLYLHMSEVE